MVYSLLKDEMAAEGGIHALQLRTRTPAEEQRIQEKEQQKAQQQGETIAEVETAAR